MKICIPTADRNGVDARVYDHFGSAPYFALADTESGSVEIIDNAGRQHRHGQCDPVHHIDAKEIDAVVCHGMGKRALSSLARGGFDVLITSGGTVREIIAEARDGKLRHLSAEEACGGRHGGHRGGHQC